MEREPFSHVFVQQRPGGRAFLASSSVHANLVLVLLFWRFISHTVRGAGAAAIRCRGARRGNRGRRGGRAGASGGQRGGGGGGQPSPPKLTIEVPRMPVYNNPPLREPLKLAHIKPRLFGHWSTTAGLNLVYGFTRIAGRLSGPTASGRNRPL